MEDPNSNLLLWVRSITVRLQALESLVKNRLYITEADIEAARQIAEAENPLPKGSVNALAEFLKKTAMPSDF